MQGENFKFQFIMVLSVALLIAIFLPLSLGIFKPSVFPAKRVAGLQTVCFGAVITLGLALVSYLLLFFEANSEILARDRSNDILFGFFIAAFGAILKLATKPRN
jgi:hypothetical protein